MHHDPKYRQPATEGTPFMRQAQPCIDVARQTTGSLRRSARSRGESYQPRAALVSVQLSVGGKKTPSMFFPKRREMRNASGREGSYFPRLERDDGLTRHSKTLGEHHLGPSSLFAFRTDSVLHQRVGAPIQRLVTCQANTPTSATIHPAAPGTANPAALRVRSR